MRIEQAIFTSSERGPIKGYQVVAKSPDIDRETAKQLHRWSPTQLGQDDPNAWTISYYPVSDDKVAVARTITGGPEYSSRGGVQVVTITAVLTNTQFAAYQNHALLVARIAMALGWLRLPSETTPGSLEPFDLPDTPLVKPEDIQDFSSGLGKTTGDGEYISGYAGRQEVDARSLARIDELIRQNNRTAVIGATNPLGVMARLIDGVAIPLRRNISFTTGLPLALHRPFQVHFLACCNAIINQTLEAEGITVVQATQPAMRS